MTSRALAALALVLAACVAPTDAPLAPAVPPATADQAKTAPGFPFWLTHVPGFARDVSDSGDVVGYNDVSGGAEAWHYRAGTLRALPAHPLYPRTSSWYEARGVNNRSEIVGFVSNNSGSVRRGLYWASPTATPVFIHPEVAGKWSPASINDNGVVVGYVDEFAPIPRLAFRWRRGSAPSALPAPNGAWSALSVNDQGHISGITLNGGRAVRLLGGITYTEAPGAGGWFARMLSNGSLPLLVYGSAAKIWRIDGSVVDATNPATGVPIGEQQTYAVSSRGRVAWSLFGGTARTATAGAEHVLVDPTTQPYGVVGVTACGSVVTNGSAASQWVVSLWLKVNIGCDAPTPLP